MENQLNTIQMWKKSTISDHFDMISLSRMSTHHQLTLHAFRSALQFTKDSFLIVSATFHIASKQMFYNVIKASHEINYSSRQHEFEGQNDERFQYSIWMTECEIKEEGLSLIIKKWKEFFYPPPRMEMVKVSSCKKCFKTTIDTKNEHSSDEDILELESSGT